MSEERMDTRSPTTTTTTGKKTQNNSNTSDATVQQPKRRVVHPNKKSTTPSHQFISIDVYFNDSGDHCLLDALNPSLTFEQMFKLLVQKRALHLIMTHPIEKNYTLNLKMTSTDSKKVKMKGASSDGYIPIKMEDTLGSSTYSAFCRPIMVLHTLPPIPHESLAKVFGNYLIICTRNPAQLDFDMYNQPIPRFLKLCFSFLSKTGISTVGIFRVSGSVREVDALSKKVDEGLFMPIKPSVDPNSISSLVKMYLRELPEPLLTFNLYEPLKQLFENEDLSENERSIKCRQLIETLPIEHYSVLEHLIAICNLMIKYGNETKMTADTLSIVIGPNIMVPPNLPGDRTEKDNHTATLKDTPIICNVASLMMRNYSQIFHHTSPYDPELKGFDDLSSEEIVLSTKKPSIIKGHLPRAVYHYNNEELPNDMSYELKYVRLIGESLILLANYADVEGDDNVENMFIERELPLDHIKEVVELQESPSLLIKYMFKKQACQIYIVNNHEEYNYEGFTGFISFNRDVNTFHAHLITVMNRYQQYIKKANAEPEKYGIVISKDELRTAKMKKQQRLAGKQETYNTNANNHGDDEFDSDSDDSVTFREEARTD